MEGVKKWAATEGKDFEAIKANIENDEDLKKEILDSINQLAIKNKFSGLERVKKFHLRAQEFTIQEDLLTNTLKLKRNVATKFFQKEFEALYGTNN